MSKKQFHHADDTERRLIKGMAKEGIPWKTIQKITGRSSDTLNNIQVAAAQGSTDQVHHEGCREALWSSGEID